jgi:hypothetical protein
MNNPVTEGLRRDIAAIIADGVGGDISSDTIATDIMLYLDLRSALRKPGLATTGQQQIAAPGNDQLSKLWNAIVENTKGDGFWIGEILLTTLEREVGFNPAALTDTSTYRGSK